MNSQNNILQMENVSSYYGESCVIEHLQFSVPAGKIVSLIGRNGVGKSTTLKSIMGVVKTPVGKIIFDGMDIAKMPTHERVKLGIGYVPQGRDIFSQMTVQENLELGLQPLGGKGTVPDYIFELFPILSKFLLRKGGDLSGGQQQQLAIARALVANPKILILDEPTEGIQPSVIKDIGLAIQKINDWKGITVLLVEQFLDFVLQNSHIVNVMEKGNIVYSSTMEECDQAKLHDFITH
ncbi:MAG: urea ABC transporter ATP-binding subunit UrtE [Pseudomonadota bacterium]